MDAHYYNGSDDREDVCTDDPLTCECPACRDWRDQQEPERDPEPVTIEEQYADACREREELSR